jgi:hypothetical protein
MKADCQVSGEGYVAAQTIVPSENQITVNLQLVPWNDLEKAKAEAAKVALQNQQTAGKSSQNGNGQTGATRTPSGTQSGTSPKTKP